MYEEPKKTSWKWSIGVLALIALAGGFYYTQVYLKKDVTPQMVTAARDLPPAVPVTVQTVSARSVRIWSDYSGRLSAVNSANIKPEVSGRITSIQFAEGQHVRKGDLLFVIDPRPFVAAVAKAEAALEIAKTNAQFTSLEEKRAETLIQSQAIAQRVYDERANAQNVAEAEIARTKADLRQATLNLEYAYVRAPISGRISRAEITVGNVVQAGPTAPLLTSIVSDDAVYADFEIDEATYISLIRRDTKEQKISVKLSLNGDNKNVYHGTIDSFDNQIDPGSGTIRARAKFANSDGALLSGMIVTVSIASANEMEAITLPETALGFDQNKKFVYVVDAKNKVVYREVELGQQIGSSRVVISGVKPGERIIIQGLQQVRPDATVIPKEQDMKAVDSEIIKPNSPKR